MYSAILWDVSQYVQRYMFRDTSQAQKRRRFKRRRRRKMIKYTLFLARHKSI